MARHYLGCPASSASVPRIFSVAGQFFDDLRRQLDDEKLEELMWAAINKGNRRKEYGTCHFQKIPGFVHMAARVCAFQRGINCGPRLKLL